jgi:proline dehydrogenase
MDLRETTVTMLPKPAIRLFSGPYVAGDSMQAAFNKAIELSRQRIASTIDVLGEDAASLEDISQYVRIYETLIEHLSSDGALTAIPERLRPSISLKPSSFMIAPKDGDGMVREPARMDWAACTATIDRIAQLASAKKVRLTVDMENHQWTDGTLALYAELFKKHGLWIGTVLQSRLFRTPEDLEKLPNGCRVRLCIGIYDEPPSIALQSIPQMKAAMIPMAKRLLEKNVYLEFATHDVPLINRFLNEIVVQGHVDPGTFETQTLLGVPRQRLIERLVSGEYFAQVPGGNGTTAALRNGIVHRMYVPFAEDWDKAIAYCRRRLKHSPNLFWTGFVNAPRVLYRSFFHK